MKALRKDQVTPRGSRRVRGTREWGGGVWSFVLALTVVLLFGCSRRESSSKQPETAAGSAVAVQGPPPLQEMQPRAGEVAGYATSSACQECHREEHASWHRSYHRTMTQLPSAEAIQADFRNVVLTNENTRFVLTRTNEEFWVHMERFAPSERREVAPEWLDTQISLVTGSHHMQVFWAPMGQGNAQLGFPFTWLIPEQRWVPRQSTFIRPPDTPHLSEVWNFTCSRCHTTAVEPRVDNVRRTADTRVAEFGIACEACHGRGEKHVAARRLAREQTTVDPAVLQQEIVQPKKLDPVRGSQVCGFCHSMKWFDAAENWRQDGFRYRPGDDLEATTPVIRKSGVAAIPGLARYLEAHPDILRDYFWPDGMIRVSGRDYNGLVESPCYRGGQFSCFSCHSLHKSEPNQQLARNRSGDAACTQCHERFKDREQVLAHTRHKDGSPGSECYNCHMPRTTYGVLKAIRSHQVSSPAIRDSLATGRPNACNLCHLDKPLSWTATHLNTWFGHAAPEELNTGSDLGEGVRLGVAGDAGQRALIAWHLGWGPVQEVTSKGWIVPVLAELLDDPYAAVRCIAERSLKSFAPTAVPAGYNYAMEPAARGEIRSQVLQRWKQSAPATPDAGAEEDSSQAQQEKREAIITTLRQARDDRPVRLRE